MLAAKEQVNGQAAARCRAELSGEFLVLSSYVPVSESRPLTCELREDVWVDEEQGFVVRNSGQAVCQAADGSRWRAEVSVEVTGVGQAQTIALPEGATILNP